MGFKTRVLQQAVSGSAEKIAKNFKHLESQMITIQENQVEFEQYLKDILLKLDDLKKK